LKKLFEYFSEDKPYLILLISTIAVSILGYIYVQKIPKPETFIELGKYLYRSPEDYLFSIVLFLLISLAYSVCAASGTYNTYLSWEDLGTFGKIFSILLIVFMLVLAIYFAAYFVLTFFVLLVLGIIAVFAAKILMDNK
jgi:hypothetical protein